MHCFTFALIAAAFTSFASAAPIELSKDLPVNVESVSRPTDLTPVLLSTGAIPPLGNLNSVEGKVKDVTEAVHARNSKITDAVKDIKVEISGVHTRTTASSVAVIFDGILTQIQPYTEQLTYIDPSNSSVTHITDVVASIKAPILAAIPQLQALVGAEGSVVLAPIGATTGKVELSVSDVTALVGGDVKVVLASVGQALAFVKGNVGDIVADVEPVLVDLGVTVTDLVAAVVPLVDGLAASLGPALASVDNVITDLKLTQLTVLLGIVL